MNWRVKALLQRFCAALPFAREPIYWFLQRRLGTMRIPNDPTFMFQEAASIRAELQRSGFCLSGARVMEVGTGRALDLPVGFYLCGAASTITFDLTPYLKSERVEQSLQFIREHTEQVRDIFLPLVDAADLDRRLEDLCRITTCRELLDVAHLDVRAPADAAHSGLAAGSVDLQISYTVFEHIPYAVLLDILREAGRVLAPGGVALHHIDLSDHFVRDDPSVSMIHFLRYSNEEWRKLAGNQYAYHNRLREPEYRRLYEEAGHEILVWESWQDARSLAELQAGFPVSSEFRQYSPELLATTLVRAISRPKK
jgi:SAM-dependent methyltransferase